MNFNTLVDALTGLTEANCPIRVRLPQGPQQLSDVLLVKRVTGSENLCGGLEYRLLCVSARADLPLKAFIAVPAELQFVTDRGDIRVVCGIVAQAAAGQSDGGLATYELVVRDELALMESRTRWSPRNRKIGRRPRGYHVWLGGVSQIPTKVPTV